MIVLLMIIFIVSVKVIMVSMFNEKFIYWMSVKVFMIEMGIEIVEMRVIVLLCKNVNIIKIVKIVFKIKLNFMFLIEVWI